MTPLEVMAQLAATWAPDVMGNPATAQSWTELFDQDIVLVEPSSLPYGGVHHGIDAFHKVQAGMRELWEQRIEGTEYWQCAPVRVTLRIVIRWTARASGRSVVLPMIDFIQFGGADINGGKIVGVEAFIFDTAALLGTLR
jgi:hypothetical protein